MSSAYNIGNDISLTVPGRSLIYIKNSNGPSTDPCGTPCFTFSHWLKDCGDNRPLPYFFFSARVKSSWSKPWNILFCICSSVICVGQWSVFRDVCGYDMEWHSTLYFPFMEWQCCLVCFLDLVVIIKFFVAI